MHDTLVTKLYRMVRQSDAQIKIIEHLCVELTQDRPNACAAVMSD